MAYFNVFEKNKIYFNRNFPFVLYVALAIFLIDPSHRWVIKHIRFHCEVNIVAERNVVLC